MSAINPSVIAVRSAHSFTIPAAIPTASLTPISTNPNSTWNAAIIVVLAVLTLVVGVPSAVVAKKLRLRQQANLRFLTDDTARHRSNDDSTNDSSDIEGHDREVAYQSITPPESAYLGIESSPCVEHVDHGSANDTFERQ